MQVHIYWSHLHPCISCQLRIASVYIVTMTILDQIAALDSKIVQLSFVLLTIYLLADWAGLHYSTLPHELLAL